MFKEVNQLKKASNIQQIEDSLNLEVKLLELAARGEKVLAQLKISTT